MQGGGARGVKIKKPLGDHFVYQSDDFTKILPCKIAHLGEHFANDPKRGGGDYGAPACA